VPLKRLLVILIYVINLPIGKGFIAKLYAQDYCDPSLVKNTDSPLGYKNRGDRCEGLYIKEVSSTTLLIASLTESFEQYDISSPKPLQIEWARPPGNGPVRLRAQGIKRRLYYRMDTSQPPGTMFFNWTPNILASLNIVKGDIGVLASTRYVVGKELQDVYLPLRIKQEGNYIHSTSYNLTLLPGVELTEVYISLTLIDTNGKRIQTIKNGEELNYGYYPAERAIEIPLSGLKAKGTYYIEIGANLRGGGSSTVELWFYNPIG
jgi:hypothetical protein